MAAFIEAVVTGVARPFCAQWHDGQEHLQQEVVVTLPSCREGCIACPKDGNGIDVSGVAGVEAMRQ